MTEMYGQNLLKNLYEVLYVNILYYNVLLIFYIDKNNILIKN